MRIHLTQNELATSEGNIGIPFERSGLAYGGSLHPTFPEFLKEEGYTVESMKEMGFNEAEALSYINYGYPCIIWEEDEVIYKQNDCHSNHWLLDGAQGKRKTKSLGGGIMLAGFHSEAFNVLKLTQGEMDGINLQRQQKG